MSVICYVNINIKDFNKYRESGYIENTGLTVGLYGGRYLVRGGDCKIIEGSPQLNRVVMIQFPSIEKFEKWYESEEYAPWRKIRHKLAESELFVLEALSKEESESITDPE